MRAFFFYHRIEALTLLCFVMLFLTTNHGVAQENTSSEPIRYEIKNLEFEGNEAVGEKELRKIILTKESPGRLSALLYHISERLGDKPEYFDRSMFDGDVARLKHFYQDNGFFNATIDTVIRFDEESKTASLKFTIHEYQRSFIDSVTYKGIDDVSTILREDILNHSVVKAGFPYTAATITQEIDRVLNLFSNHGYSKGTVDTVTVQRRLSMNSLIVNFVFSHGPLFHFGDVGIKFQGEKDYQIDESIVFRQLEFEPGQISSLEKKTQSERNLYRIGIFESVKIDAKLASEGDTSTSVPVLVLVKPRDKHELTPEVFANDADNAFNLGIGMGYTNRNFLGDARNFSTRLRFRIQSIQRVNFFRVFTESGFKDSSIVANVDLTFQLIQPYVFTKRLSGNLAFSLIADKQKPYLQTIIRNRTGLSYQFSRYAYGFLDWNIERSTVEIFDSTGIDSTRFSGEQRPQLNSILTFTLQQDRTNDIFSPSDGYFVSFALEEAGILPLVVKKFGSSLPFSQYYKATLFSRWYHDLSNDRRFSIFATKLKLGFAQKYRLGAVSEDLPIPLHRRFFAGGSGSVRGWRTRELGTVAQPKFGGNFIFEANAEMRINIFQGLGDIGFVNLNNIWTVFFFDVGNLWESIGDFTPHQLAIASGLGFRYDTLFGPFRIDFGFRVYDPGEISGRQWFTAKKFWKETVAAGVLHFGIGHAF